MILKSILEWEIKFEGVSRVKVAHDRVQGAEFCKHGNVFLNFIKEINFLGAVKISTALALPVDGVRTATP
jgi:hypothetical protein